MDQITLKLKEYFACISSISEPLLTQANSFGHISNNYGSLAATLAATAIIFLIKEFYKKPPNVSGRYYLKLKTIKSEYNPYIHMELFYILTLISDGKTISGHSEKTGEINTKESIEYIGAERRIGTITGLIERNFFRRSHIHLLLLEDGSRKIAISIKTRTSKLGGSFFSTAADSEGTVSWSREKFKEHPSKSSQPQSTS